MSLEPEWARWAGLGCTAGCVGGWRRQQLSPQVQWLLLQGWTWGRAPVCRPAARGNAGAEGRRWPDRHEPARPASSSSASSSCSGTSFWSERLIKIHDATFPNRTWTFSFGLKDNQANKCSDFYLFVWQIELLAQLGLVLRSQIGVSLEGPLHAADLLRCEGRAGPPPWRRRRRRGGRAALCGGRGRERVISFALIAGGLLLCPTAKADLCGVWKTQTHNCYLPNSSTTKAVISYYLISHSEKAPYCCNDSNMKRTMRFRHLKWKCPHLVFYPHYSFLLLQPK